MNVIPVIRIISVAQDDLTWNRSKSLYFGQFSEVETKANILKTLQIHIHIHIHIAYVFDWRHRAIAKMLRKQHDVGERVIVIFCQHTTITLSSTFRHYCVCCSCQSSRTYVPLRNSITFQGTRTKNSNLEISRWLWRPTPTTATSNRQPLRPTSLAGNLLNVYF